MCKKLFLLISVVLVLSLTGYASAQDGVIPAAGAPVIDGVKDPNWDISPGYPIDNNSIGDHTTPANLSCSWWAVWDTDYLYVFVDVNDSQLYNDSDASYEDDSVEVFIDIGNDKLVEQFGEDDYQYRIGWGIAKGDPTKPITIEEYDHPERALKGVVYELVTKGGNDGYTVEIKIPWDTLDYLDKGISIGDEMGFEVQVNDDDNGTARERAYAWINTDNVAWNDPSTFGTIVFQPGYQACQPDPYDGETGILSGLLQWTPGIHAAGVAGHEVYFDTSKSNVESRLGCVVNGAVTNDPCYTAPVTADTTYYWAVDEVNVAGPSPYEWPGNVWEFTTAPLEASNPDPCDGDLLASVDADLAWDAGFYAEGHKVYLDTLKTNVQSRSGCEINGEDASEPYYALAALEPDTTYYWAIDEVNTIGPNWPGDVWEFTTVPVPDLGTILVQRWDNITGAAVSDLTSNIRYPDSPDATSEADTLSDPSGGEEYGARLHGWLYIWPTAKASVVGVPMSGDDDYTFWIASNDQSELWLSTNDDPENAVLISSVSTATEGGYTEPGEWTKSPEQRSSPVSLQAGQQYYIMALHKEATGQDHMSVAWSNTTDPCNAEIINGRYYLVPFEQTVSYKSSPRNGATDVESAPDLSWSPGKYADTHDLYFGTDRTAVRDANTSSPECIAQDIPSVDPTIYGDLGLLEFDTTYYWRVDDINPAGPDPCYWKGRTWGFTTGRYHAVEDFEGYDDTDELDVVWSAHSDISATSDMICEFHRDDQAMAIQYNNSNSYSEAYADANGTDSIGFGNNWRLKEAKALALWVHGIGGLQGSYTGSDPYTLEGGGSGLDNTKYDTCYFFYKSIANAYARVQVRVDSLENTDAGAMAGVMLRQNLNADSAYATTVITADNEVIFMGRGSAGTTGSAIGDTVSDITLPHWIRITRYSQMGPAVLYAEHANDVDGSPDYWETVGTPQNWGFSSPIYIGLCVTSNVYGDMCTAKFSNVYMGQGSSSANPDGTEAGDPDSGTDIGDYVYNDPEPMFVTLKDGNNDEWTEYIDGGDDTVTQTAEWTQYRLDLKNFDDNDVDPCDIQTIYIGVGAKDNSSSGSGTVFIDDIRLYVAEFYEPECPPLKADLVRDGEVNNDDLKLVTDNWLVDEYTVTPAVPPVGPVAWYELEDNADDSAGSHDGNEVGDPTYTTDAQQGTYAIDLDGTTDHVDVNAVASDFGIAGDHGKSITAWAKLRTFVEGDEGFRGVYEIGGKEEGGMDFSMLTSGDEPNVWRANHEGGPETFDIDFEYPSLNEWVHFAHTYDGTTVRVYVDGYAVAEAQRVLDLNTTDEKPFAIGQWTSWGDYYFDGLVDDVRIYDYALSQANAAYVAGKTTPFTQPLDMLLTPPNPDINLHVEGSPEIIDFRDFAVLGAHWYETQVWPTW